MDGYALHDFGHAGDVFTVIGTAAAGARFGGRVGKGEAVRIFTGAPVPDGTSHIVIQEDVRADANRIVLREGVDSNPNIRPQGQDFRLGDQLSPRRLGPRELALLAAMNVPEVSVARRPVVAFIATGDELVMPGETPAADQIVASNLFALKAMAEAEGAEVRLLPIARDTEDDLTSVLALGAGADLVVTIGGASVGDHDLVGRVTETLGMVRSFYKIAMRPGKPLMAGRLRGVPMLGLPGNPVSSIVCAHLFMLPLVRAMQGLAPAPVTKRALLANDVGPAGSRTHYMRARLSEAGGLPRIAPFDRQDSALLRVLSEADALLIRPAGDGAREAGTEADYLLL